MESTETSSPQSDSKDIDSCSLNDKEESYQSIVESTMAELQGMSVAKDHPHFDKENDEGNVEYKWKLVSKDQLRIEKLTTQLNYRLQEGGGQATYQLGVEDDGNPRGLTDWDLASSIATVRVMVKQLARTTGQILQLCIEKVMHGQAGKMATVSVTNSGKVMNFQDVRVCCVGLNDSGKSTLVGVLTGGRLDNGHGLARSDVVRHIHELENGRTSSISRHILGFDKTGEALYPGDTLNGDSGWSGVVEGAHKILTFVDLAGHEAYLKTTLSGLASQIPDYCLIAAAANAALPCLTKAHMRTCLVLGIPMFLVLTKVDLCEEEELRQAATHAQAALGQLGLQGVVVGSQGQVQHLTDPGSKSSKQVPVFLVSSVTGQGLALLKRYVYAIPRLTDWSAFISKPFEFAIDDTFQVEGVGTVVSGTVMRGCVAAGTHAMLGPFSNGSYRPVEVVCLHVHGCVAQSAQAGQSASLALSGEKEEEEEEKVIKKVRKRQVLCLIVCCNK
mmetsp:Transcript_9695/g.14154  ORF Transcript_9695/g.14154 Transcript_9695/m.14154 type:complete len:502 (-) Transcript_9695:16-1521(-)